MTPGTAIYATGGTKAHLRRARRSGVRRRAADGFSGALRRPREDAASESVRRDPVRPRQRRPSRASREVRDRADLDGRREPLSVRSDGCARRRDARRSDRADRHRRRLAATRGGEELRARHRADAPVAVRSSFSRRFARATSGAAMRRNFAVAAFERTAEYDAAISHYLGSAGEYLPSDLPGALALTLPLAQRLRYGDESAGSRGVLSRPPRTLCPSSCTARRSRTTTCSISMRRCGLLSRAPLGAGIASERDRFVPRGGRQAHRAVRRRGTFDRRESGRRRARCRFDLGVRRHRRADAPIDRAAAEVARRSSSSRSSRRRRSTTTRSTFCRRRRTCASCASRRAAR